MSFIRVLVRLAVLAVLAGLAIQAASPSALAAAAAPESRGATADCGLKGLSQRLSSSRIDVVFRPEPAPIRVGQHFALDVLVCPHRGVTAPTSFSVDAGMPEHRHGMNYKPSVQQLPSSSRIARYRVEGMMFHMAGRWELVIEVRAGGHTNRLTSSITVE